MSELTLKEAMEEAFKAKENISCSTVGKALTKLHDTVKFQSEYILELEKLIFKGEIE